MTVGSILKLGPLRAAKRSIARAARRGTEGVAGGQQVSGTPAVGAEPLELSADARLFQAIDRMLEERSETREERVKAVKEKLGGERYQVDNRHLARLILEQVEDSRRDYRAAA